MNDFKPMTRKEFQAFNGKLQQIYSIKYDRRMRPRESERKQKNITKCGAYLGIQIDNTDFYKKGEIVESSSDESDSVDFLEPNTIDAFCS